MNAQTPSNEASPVVAPETVNLDNLENLAGLVEDMMDRNMITAGNNLEEAVRQRLGNNATVDDAKRAIEGLTAAFAD